MMELQGKTALISGGGGGIGRAVGLSLAHEGAKIAVADIARDNAEKVRDEVQALGVEAMACPVDLTKNAEPGKEQSPEEQRQTGQVPQGQSPKQN